MKKWILVFFAEFQYNPFRMKAKLILLLLFVGFLAIFACTNQLIERVLDIGTEPPAPVTVPKTEGKTPTPNLVDLRWIPAGTFMMGSPESEPGRDPSPSSSYETQHKVTLTKGFYMGKYPVTQAQYKVVMGTNPSAHRVGGSRASYLGIITDTTNFPVENVSWYDVLVFCNKLSMLEGLSPAYQISGSTDPDDWGETVPTDSNSAWNNVKVVEGSTGYRLPTEAQWEYACRAGTTTAFNTGATISDNTGWYRGNSEDRTYKVGLKLPNAWGLYDMHGNVWEWCWDGYGYYTSEAQTDPTGPGSGSLIGRMLRGGGFSSTSEWHLRSAWRVTESPFSRDDPIGFRVVRP